MEKEAASEYLECSVPAEEEFVLMPAVGRTLVVGIKEWLKKRSR